MLPFGDFALEPERLESVMRRGREEESSALPNGDVYLRFGLPRVALPQAGGTYGLYQQGRPFQDQRRRAQSDLDLRNSAEPPPSFDASPLPNPNGGFANGFQRFGGSVGGLDALGGYSPNPTYSRNPGSLYLMPDHRIQLTNTHLTNVGGPQDVFDAGDFAPNANGGPPSTNHSTTICWNCIPTYVQEMVPLGKADSLGPSDTTRNTFPTSTFYTSRLHNYLPSLLPSHTIPTATTS